MFGVEDRFEPRPSATCTMKGPSRSGSSRAASMADRYRCARPSFVALVPAQGRAAQRNDPGRVRSAGGPGNPGKKEQPMPLAVRFDGARRRRRPSCRRCPPPSPRAGSGPGQGGGSRHQSRRGLHPQGAPARHVAGHTSLGRAATWPRSSMRWRGSTSSLWATRFWAMSIPASHAELVVAAAVDIGTTSEQRALGCGGLPLRGRDDRVCRSASGPPGQR